MKHWTRGKKLKQKKCARGSMRTIKPKRRVTVHGKQHSPGNTLLIVCCPPGKWMPRKKKCKVSMKGHLLRTLKR